MPSIHPFRSWLPQADRAQEIIVKPSNVSQDAAIMLQWAKQNPHAFYSVRKPDQFSKELKSKPKSEIFKEVKLKFEAYKSSGLLYDSAEAFYIYRQRSANGHQQIGLIANCDSSLYNEAKIKRHEHTLEAKETDLIEFVRSVKLHVSPVFLGYRHSDKLDAIIQNWVETHPSILEFDGNDKCKHTVWQIDQVEIISQIQEVFNTEVTALYIADGHHRAAATAKAFQKGIPNYGESGPMMVGIYPEHQMQIYEFHRLIKALPSFNQQDFMSGLLANFNLTMSHSKVRPSKPNTFGMSLHGQWYSLELKEASKPNSNRAVDHLDVSIWTKLIAEPLLGIVDQRNDNRIDFIGGVEPIEHVLHIMKQHKYPLLFTFFPVQIQHLFAVADEGDVMPPKSTWFEPKMPSGIFIQEI